MTFCWPSQTISGRRPWLWAPPNGKPSGRCFLPYGLSGILGAVILGLGRALGETMAVTMVIGNSIEGSASLLRPGYTMASIIANEFAEAVTKLHSQSLIEIGLVLFFMTLILNMVARFLVWSVARKTPQEVRA